MSTAVFNTWQNSDGTVNYKCRAWVNFNGTTSPGTIRASGNVSSVTKNGTGDYTVNFTTAMPDANYSVGGSAQSANDASANALFQLSSQSSLSTTSVRIRILYPAVAYVDSNTVCVSIFR